MRLINTSTGLFEEFIGRNIPKYAILSHTWGEGEVSFKDMSDPAREDKKGYKKIVKTCEMASQAGTPYAWVDTCCIDKSSSAELTEAINSMYRWYGGSEICYAYLSDLPASASVDSDTLHNALKKCRWFFRGWTLQELIAPRDVYFFDMEWNYIGSKRDLTPSLESITGINQNILLHEQPLKSVVVAERMSWAAHRKTTRVEDTAYCLLGIFDVNMPLLYGEEERAFRRLQEEIIKSTDDLSIFAWTVPKTISPSQPPEECIYSGVLTDSPAAFSRIGFDKKLGCIGDISITNRGIKCQAAMRVGAIPKKQGEHYILAVATYRGQSSRWSLGIRVKKYDSNRFVREDPHAFVNCDSMRIDPPQEVYLLIDPPATPLKSIHLREMRPEVLSIKLLPNMRIIYDSVEPKSRYDVESELFFAPEYFECDSCILSLSLLINPTFITKFTLFITHPWSEFDTPFGLIHDEPFRDQLAGLRDKIKKQTCSSDRIQRYLVSNGIPISNKIAIKIPGGNTSALILADRSWGQDEENRPTLYPRVEVSSKIAQTGSGFIEDFCRMIKLESSAGTLQKYVHQPPNYV